MEQTKKVVPQNLTPVTIMVVDTISSVRSSTLLRVLLDSGSTTSLCFKRCLPKNCKPQEIASSRKVNTLSEPYTSTEVVIMCNLRLPEFDKNRNINQLKVLVFQSETCNYDVIPGSGCWFSDKKQVLMSNTAQEPWNGSTMSCHSAILAFFKKRSLMQWLK